MKKCILLLFSVICTWASAQNPDVVYDTAGNIYDGYMECQQPGRSITVQSYKTTVVFPAEEAKTIVYSSKMLCQLPDDFAELFPEATDTTVVEVVTITTSSGTTYRDALLQESGVTYKIVVCDNKSYTVPWNELFKIAHGKYDLSASKGVLDVIVLKTGERLEGQILEQNIKSGQIKFITRDGTIVSYNTSSILAIRLEPLDKSISIFEQSPLIDRLKLRDGTSVEGIITSKVIGKQVELVEKSNQRKIISVSEIVTYYKMLNSSYTPDDTPADTVVETTSDLVFNGMDAKFASIFEDDSYLYISTSEDSLECRASVGANVRIKMKTAVKTYEIKFFETTARKAVFLKKEGSITRKSTELWPAFRLNQSASVNINFISNDGNYMEFECSFGKPGVYVLYLPSEPDHCVAIAVK